MMFSSFYLELVLCYNFGSIEYGVILSFIEKEHLP